ncbi:MAG: hypothetical protein AAFQ43_13925 [Bacteroidota bacterium]
MDPIVSTKNAARIATARGLQAVSAGFDAASATGERLLRRLGLPTRTDLGRLARAVADLDRAADDLRTRS